MRGQDEGQAAMFSYLSPERRVPKDHPLRPIRELVDAALKQLSPRFDDLYADSGRPSIAPERLLRALLLQILYTVRSERMLVEQLDYNLLFRWFVGLSMDDAVWDATTFTKNRDRLLEGEIAQAFFDEVLGQARQRRLLSNEHFTVDGTLIKAWAGHKSFRKKGRKGDKPMDGDSGNPTVNFRGEKRSNETHESTTDPESRLARKKGKESALCYQGHVLMENRNGLVVNARLTQATGGAEREAALAMLWWISGTYRVTLGGDKGYDARAFVEAVRELNITPHVAQNVSGRSSAIDSRTVRHDGYAASQRRRKRIEEVFGWMKTVGPMRQTRFRGSKRVGWMFTLTAAAYNLVRIRNLCAAT
jgi:transposase